MFNFASEPLAESWNWSELIQLYSDQLSSGCGRSEDLLWSEGICHGKAPGWLAFESVEFDRARVFKEKVVRGGWTDGLKYIAQVVKER